MHFYPAQPILELQIKTIAMQLADKSMTVHRIELISRKCCSRIAVPRNISERYM